MNDKEIADYLTLWFNKAPEKQNKDVKNFWGRDPIAIVIRERLTKLDRWMVKGRGDPAKGLEVFRANEKVRKELAKQKKIEEDNTW